MEKQFSNMNQKSFKKYIHFGTSLMAQWLRLPAPKTQGMGSTPSGELRFCMLYSMIKKKKKKVVLWPTNFILEICPNEIIKN